MSPRFVLTAKSTCHDGLCCHSLKVECRKATVAVSDRVSRETAVVTVADLRGETVEATVAKAGVGRASSMIATVASVEVPTPDRRLVEQQNSLPDIRKAVFFSLRKLVTLVLTLPGG